MKNNIDNKHFKINYVVIVIIVIISINIKY